MTCHCAKCLLARLRGISSLLRCGRSGVAAATLDTVVAELAGVVAASRSTPAEQHTKPKPTGPATSIRRAARLAKVIERRPDLRAVAASVLKIRATDVDVIATGRALLTTQRWNQLFAAIDPDHGCR